jgi:hypothetical protein
MKQMLVADGQGAQIWPGDAPAQHVLSIPYAGQRIQVQKVRGPEPTMTTIAFKTILRCTGIGNAER